MSTTLIALAVTAEARVIKAAGQAPQAAEDLGDREDGDRHV